MNNRQIKIGWLCTLVGTTETTRDLMNALLDSTDEKGKPIDFSVQVAEDLEEARMKEHAEKLAKEALDREQKSWSQQYDRANKAESALRALKEKYNET